MTPPFPSCFPLWVSKGSRRVPQANFLTEHTEGALASFGAPSVREHTCSALVGAEGEAGDELLLEREEHHEGRHRHDQRGRGDQVVVHEELALEVVQRLCLLTCQFRL